LLLFILIDKGVARSKMWGGHTWRARNPGATQPLVRRLGTKLHEAENLAGFGCPTQQQTCLVLFCHLWPDPPTPICKTSSDLHQSLGQPLAKSGGRHVHPQSTPCDAPVYWAHESDFVSFARTPFHLHRLWTIE